MTKFKLISFDTCPYVERSRIVLIEKGQEFEQEFIDLQNKPDWFLKISPRGKVPVLVLDDRPIFESSVINELLDELVPEPAMFPRDPVARAQARSWIVYNNDVVFPALAMHWFARGNVERREKGRKAIREAFERLDSFLASREDGPFFMGEEFGLVDANYAPIFTRWAAMREIGEETLVEGLDSLTAYGEALLQRPSVQQAQAEDLTTKMLETIKFRDGAPA